MVLGPGVADWGALNRELALDPITYEILRHKLQAINQEQAIALKDVSVSPIVTAASDFNNALYTADGRIASMGPHVVFHSGSMPIVLRNVMKDFDGEIEEGDMFAVNDPYYGAVHHPDVSLVAPIHHEGELVAWAGVAAHQVDMGGMSVGSISPRAREKFQEGLMMPPVKLVERGRVRGDLWRLILNMTRQPQMVGLDLKGFIASNTVARDRLAAIMRRYGAETVKTVMEESIRYSERRMRERLLTLPDGEFRSREFLDHDGIANRVYRTDIRLTKDGDRMRFDFSESSPQSPGYINCTEACLIGAVFGGVAPLLGHGLPWNHGILNAIEVIAPQGLIVNANHPAACGAATIGQGWTIVNVTTHVVSKLLALSEEMRRHSQAVTNGSFAAIFTGDRNQYGEPFGNQLIDAQIGGGGASAVADGIDQSGAFVAPKPHIANVETNEVHGPMLFLYRAFFPDSGGDGAFRGGRAAGSAWIPYGVEQLRCSVTAHGVEVPVSYGQFGGWPGVCNRQMVISGTRVMDLFESGELPLMLESITEPIDLKKLGGEMRWLAAKVEEFNLQPGDVVQYTWQGGGGYGDPLERDPVLVERDVQLGDITRRRAEDRYGVTLGDPKSTRERRAGIRSARLKGATMPTADRPGVGPRVRGEPEGRFGPSLVLARSADGLQLECSCGYVFCSTDENWKERAAWRRIEGEDLPPGIRMHESLELIQYLCPACACQHAIDVKERSEPALQDIKLARYESPLKVGAHPAQQGVKRSPM